MRIDAIGVVSTNFERTVAFYRILGFDFEEFEYNETHLEAKHKPGEIRLMIDDVNVAERLIGGPFRPANTSAFALYFESPKEVDTVVEKVSDAGYVIVQHPWDADWGQRYAIVEDPDGNRIDLFAYLGT